MEVSTGNAGLGGLLHDTISDVLEDLIANALIRKLSKPGLVSLLDLVDNAGTPDHHGIIIAVVAGSALIRRAELPLNALNAEVRVEGITDKFLLLGSCQWCQEDSMCSQSTQVGVLVDEELAGLFSWFHRVLSLGCGCRDTVRNNVLESSNEECGDLRKVCILEEQ